MNLSIATVANLNFVLGIDRDSSFALDAGMIGYSFPYPGRVTPSGSDTNPSLRERVDLLLARIFIRFRKKTIDISFHYTKSLSSRSVYVNEFENFSSALSHNCIRNPKWSGSCMTWHPALHFPTSTDGLCALER